MAIQYLYYRVRIDRMQLAWNVIDNVINARQRIDYGQYGTIEWNVWVCVKEKWKKKNIWLSEYDPNGLIKCVHGDDWNSQQMNE